MLEDLQAWVNAWYAILSIPLLIAVNESREGPLRSKKVHM